jgi:cystathionine beta-lyase
MFLTHGRVALSSGHAFGTGGHGFVRINYATSATILRQALQRMRTAAAQTG